jgi:glycosyltransferase involved in cell wall biosynthesis
VRVVLASDWWPPRLGGIESQMADLAGVLASRGHQVHVLTTTDNPVSVPGVTIERVALPKIGHLAAPDPRRLRDIAGRLEQLAPDVVHAHGMFSSFALGTTVAARRHGVPSVFTVHSLLRPWPVFLGGSALLRMFANRADVLTGVSAATVRDVALASGREPVRMPNGVHLAAWRTAAGQAAPGVRLVAVTRLAPKKSPVDLVYALRDTVRRLNGADVTMTIAGDGPQRQTLERVAAELGVADRLRLLGRCSRDQVRALLNGASLLAHPVRLEAFGLAILEARAAGLPVVAMAAGGVPDLVTHRHNGLLARSPREFHAAVAELAADEGLRRHCAANAAGGLDEFDWPNVVIRHEAVYARAIDLARRQARRSR